MLEWEKGNKFNLGKPLKDIDKACKYTCIWYSDCGAKKKWFSGNRRPVYMQIALESGFSKLENFMQFSGWGDNHMKTTVDIAKAIDRLDRFQKQDHAQNTWCQFCKFLANKQNETKEAWRIPSNRR